MTDAQVHTDAVATAPPIPKICANCKHWRQKHMAPNFGSCDESFKAGAAPILTTDHSRCGAWSLRE